MNQKEEDKSTLTTVLNRFNKWRLPQALEVRNRLEQGKSLSERDLEFLHRAFESATQVMPIIERNPEYKPLAKHAIALFNEITKLALENEQVNSVKSHYDK